MRPEDPELARLLGDFIPVRITRFNGVDMNRFRFDYDLTFAVLMMDADGRTYARFGSQDHTTSTSRMSILGLKQAMRGVLALSRKDPTAVPAPAAQAPRTLDDIPAFRKLPAAKQACDHCHFAHQAEDEQLRLEGRFTKASLYRYPLPENAGLTLDVDRNNVVQKVLPGSAAEAAGVRPGDAIAKAEARPVFSAADLQFVLDAVPDPGQVRLTLERDGKPLPAVTLRLPMGWRKTDISWRPSQGSIPPILGIWEKPLDEVEKSKLGIATDRMALRVSFLFPGPKWVPTRGDLKMNDVLTGVNGEALPAMTPRQFHTWFRMRFEVGDTATLNVLRDGRKVDVKVPCLEVEVE